MRHAWLVGMVLVWSTVAVADDKADITKALREHFDVLGSTTDPASISDMSRHRPDDYQGGLISPFLNKIAAKISQTFGKTEIVVIDKATAWFHVTVGVFLDGKLKENLTARVNGIALKHDGRWRVDAELIAMTVSDVDLVADARKATPVAIPKTPAIAKDADKQLATLVAGWITNGGLAKSASASKQNIAAGTASHEYRTGANAGTLAAGWDSLKMKPIEVDARRFSPTLGFAIVKVALNMPKQKAVVGMLLGVVLVKEKDSWRWQSLNWAPVVWNPLPENEDTDPDSP